MTTLADFLTRIRRIHLPAKGPLVCETVAREMMRRFAPEARIRKGAVRSRPPQHTLNISVGRPPPSMKPGKAWVHFHIDAANGGERAHLAASDGCYLYAFFSYLVDVLLHHPVTRFTRKRLRHPAFLWQRPIFDLYYAQSGRSIRNMDREEYVRRMAQFGFTHLEVNSLAFPEAAETGVRARCTPGSTRIARPWTSSWTVSSTGVCIRSLTCAPT